MKWFLVACAVCVVAVSAAPDELGKLMDPKSIVAIIAETVTASDAPPVVEENKPVEPNQGSVEDRTRLLSNLFSGYNNKVNPDNLTLKFGVSLIDFHVCDKRDVLESHVWLRYVWEDSRLKWDPKEYGGAEVIRIPPSEVWKPDVTIYNTADPVNMVNCWDSNVLIYSSGKILWVPPCKMTTMCHFTLNKEPYGEQVCNLKFGSWTLDGYALDLQFYNQTNPGVDTTDLNNSSGFELLSNTAERDVKYYPCCAEPYLSISYNLTIKRIPGEELFNKM